MIALEVVIALIGVSSMAVGLCFLALAVIRLVRHESARAFGAVIVALTLAILANLSMDVWRALVDR